MEVNLRDPNSLACRIYVGKITETIAKEILEVKFSAHGKIVGILRTSPTYCFIQYDQPSSAANAVSTENGTFLAGKRIIVKMAEMKHQKQKLSSNEITTPSEDEPMNKKYFSEANEYYGNNSIMGNNSSDSDVNHCEIIVVSKELTSYAEEIERLLKMLGIKVDLLFPNDKVPINKVLGNIQMRGCFYAILILPANMSNRSLTLTVLYGDTAEHRNMPMEDAIKFIYKDFTNKLKGVSQSHYQHPDAVQTLLKTLTENRSLTVLQYDHIVKYLTQRRDVQMKAEIGEDANVSTADSAMDTSHSLPIPLTTQTSATTAVAANPETNLKMKILDILRKKPIIQQSNIINSQPTQNRDELKNKLFQDPKVISAMASLKMQKK